jgi:DNA-directed RNA polymerase specialized sigma24 family protein
VRLHLLQHLQQGRTLSFAYAVRVAQGVLADFVQAQQRQPPAIPLKDADSHGGREPSLELRAAVRWALEQLPPDARALVWLHGVEGYTAEELTERFGCNAARLRQRL